MEQHGTAKVKKTPKMNVLIFRRVFVYNIIILLGALCIVLVMTFRFVLAERGNSRVDLLQQISDSNTSNRSTMISVMDHIYDKIAPYFDQQAEGNPSAEQINAWLRDIQGQASTFGCDYKIDVVLHDKTVYSTRAHSDAWLKSMLQSYWYIKHFSGESETSWNLRFQDAKDLESYSLCYARTLYDGQNNPIGVILLGSSPSSLFRTYQKLLDEDSTIYILDEKGIVISHSNPNMIGVWLYTIEAFTRQYKLGSYTLTQKAGRELMVSSYQDPESGWIFVEEQPVREFFLSYSKVILLTLLVVMAAFLFSIIQSYWSIRRISRPLIECARHMGFIRDDQFTLMPIQQQYREILVLSAGYNDMLTRIRNLIQGIKAEENEKRQIEFAFLQAQINPHFLRNTLLGIKSLVLTGQAARASEMISAFMDMLNIPIKADLHGHRLHDEIEYVRRYITLMEFRYGREFHCAVYVEDGLEQMIIPPLILQPLVENAIFHGLAAVEDAAEGAIFITACHCGANILLCVEDTGGGMTEGQLARIWNPEDASDKRSVNSIGLRNVLSRVKYVFGEQTHIEIESEEGKGTTIRIVIVREGDRY
ncbi:MAG: sensor histidine kinase [Intestinibacillus sp.]